MQRHGEHSFSLSIFFSSFHRLRLPRFSLYASFVLNPRKMDVPLVSVQPYSVCSTFSMNMSSQKRPQFLFLSDPTTRRGHSANIVDFLPSGYIGKFEIVDEHRSNKIVIQLNGRLNPFQHPTLSNRVLGQLAPPR